MSDYWKECENLIMLPDYAYKFSRDGEGPPPPKKLFQDSAFSNLMSLSVNYWAQFGHTDAPTLPCSFGFSSTNESVAIDFVRIRQLLISGSQGSGKSNALTVLLFSIMYFTSPKLLRIHIFDHKKDFAPLYELCNVFTNEQDILNKLREIRKGLDKTNAKISSMNMRNILSANEKLFANSRPLLPVNLIIFDEYVSFVSMYPEAQDIIAHLSQLGRSSGNYLILAMQRADSEAVNPQIKANIPNRYSFAQADNVNARVANVVGAENIIKPGHAILRYDLNHYHVYVPELKDDEVTNIIHSFKTHMCGFH